MMTVANEMDAFEVRTGLDRLFDAGQHEEIRKIIKEAQERLNAGRARTNDIRQAGRTVSGGGRSLARWKHKQKTLERG
jgi:hypothetical protein